MKRIIAPILMLCLLWVMPLYSLVSAAGSFVYTDTESGTVFTVPTGWEQKEFTEDREVIDAKFVSVADAGCTMIYGSVDVWEELTATEKRLYKREEWDSADYTKSDVARMMGTTADNIVIIAYNGKPYFKGEIDYSTEALGVAGTVTMTQMIYMENGWMYMFQFSGSSDHELYGDFESLLNSVQYPALSTTEKDDAPRTTTRPAMTTKQPSYNTTATTVANNDTADSAGWIAIIILAAVAAIVVIAVVLSQKNSIKVSPSPDHTTAATNDGESTVSCRNCGQAVPTDSAFCHQCGTRIDGEM